MKFPRIVAAIGVAFLVSAAAPAPAMAHESGVGHHHWVCSWFPVFC